MRKAVVRFLAFALLALAASSCGTVMNPYKSGYKCSPDDFGKCVSVQEAYQESLGESVRKPGEARDPEDTEDKRQAPANPELAYQQGVYRKMAKMMAEPETPIVVPPPVVRVLFFSYRGEGNVLFGYRRAFFFADEPRWIMDQGDKPLGD